jgi:hypothetical protein
VRLRELVSSGRIQRHGKARATWYSLAYKKVNIMESKSPIYEERFVAFVDILGFSDLVKRTKDNEVLRHKVAEALKKVRTFDSPEAGESGLRVHYFSDSLIASTTKTPLGLWHLLLSLDALAWNLLQMDVLVRGGVAVGKIYYEDEIVFGEGIIEAYRLENTVAKFPRIILGCNTFNLAKIYSSEDDPWKAYFDARLLRDKDGVMFLNFLNDMAAGNGFKDNIPNSGELPWVIAGNQVREIIQNRIDTTLDSPEIYAKLEWLARYWNTVVTCGRDSKALAVGGVVLAGETPSGSPLPFRTV